MATSCICTKCTQQKSRVICRNCMIRKFAGPNQSLASFQCEISRNRELIRGLLRDKTLYDSWLIRALIENTEGQITRLKDRLSRLCISVNDMRRKIDRRKANFILVAEKLEARKKRLAPKPEFTISLGAYMTHPSRYDKIISSLHPLRKLRAMARNLYDERRALCMKLLSLYQFRQVTVRRDSVEDSGPTSELVGDFYTPEGTGDQSYRILVLFYVTGITIQLSQVLDVPLPFPIIFGTSVSSPCLHPRPSILESGSPPYPRVLHAFKRVLLPLYSDMGYVSSIYDNAINLLIENLRYLAGLGNQVPVNSIHVLPDLVALLGVIFNSPYLGTELHYPQLGSFPSSPSLSASCSPSASYRKPVIEQSVAEGGEWTLLDQL